MTGRTLGQLLDADGSFYNRIYHNLVILVISKFSVQILEFVEKLTKNERDPISEAALVKQIETFISEVNIFNIELPKSLLEEKIFIFSINRLKELKLITEEDSISEVFAAIRNIYIPLFDLLSRSIMDLIFIKANEKFIHHLFYNIAINKIKNIILFSGSARQSHSLELTNADKNGTRIFCDDLDMFKNYLSFLASEKSLDVTFTLDLISTTDHAAGLPLGEAFTRILNRHNKSVTHHPTTYDVNKLTLVWPVSQHLPTTYPEPYASDELTLELYDNKKSILKALYTAFDGEDRSQLLPEALPIHLIYYTGFKRKPLGMIVGTGRVEKNYSEYYKLMVSMCKEKIGQSKRKIDAVNDLDFDSFLNKYLFEPPLQKSSLLTSLQATMYPRSHAQIEDQFERECKRIRMIND